MFSRERLRLRFSQRAFRHSSFHTTALRSCRHSLSRRSRVPRFVDRSFDCSSLSRQIDGDSFSRGAQSSLRAFSGPTARRPAACPRARRRSAVLLGARFVIVRSGCRSVSHVLPSRCLQRRRRSCKERHHGVGSVRRRSYRNSRIYVKTRRVFTSRKHTANQHAHFLSSFSTPVHVVNHAEPQCRPPERGRSSILHDLTSEQLTVYYPERMVTITSAIQRTSIQLLSKCCGVRTN